MEAKINGEVITFQFGIDFPTSSVYNDLIFTKGTIGGSGNAIEFPYIETLNPSLASLLRSQFLSTFTPDSSGNINVFRYVLGAGILPSAPDGGVGGFEYNTTLDEEYIVTGTLTSIDRVPEPSTMSLLLSGLFGVIAIIQKRRSIQGGRMR